MPLRLVLALLLGLVTVAWADPADDLRACQAQVGALTIQTRQTEQGRDAYILQLGKTIGEMHEQLDQARQQVQSLTQELQRVKVPKPPEAAKPEDKK